MLKPEAGFGWEAEPIFQSKNETFLLAEVSSSISQTQREVLMSYALASACLFFPIEFFPLANLLSLSSASDTHTNVVVAPT